MGAECEKLAKTEPCGILAVGRCDTCGSSFCRRHAAIAQGDYGYRYLRLDLCRSCQESAEAAEELRVRQAEAEILPRIQEPEVAFREVFLTFTSGTVRAAAKERLGRMSGESFAKVASAQLGALHSLKTYPIELSWSRVTRPKSWFRPEERETESQQLRYWRLFTDGPRVYLTTDGQWLRETSGEEYGGGRSCTIGTAEAESVDVAALLGRMKPAPWIWAADHSAR